VKKQERVREVEVYVEAAPRSSYQNMALLYTRRRKS